MGLTTALENSLLPCDCVILGGLPLREFSRAVVLVTVVFTDRVVATELFFFITYPTRRHRS